MRTGSRNSSQGVLFRSVGAAVPFLSILVWSAPVTAEPTATERAAAESLFQDGRRLLDAGQIATACTKFAESQRLAPALGSLLNLAACHELEGKTASAWVEFSEAATLAERAGERERAAYATERMRTLGNELAQVTITVPAWREGMLVTLDGREIRPAAFGTAIPIDPGEHRIRASAPDRRPWERSLVVGRGASAVAITVPELEPVSAPAVAPAPVAVTEWPREASRVSSTATSGSLRSDRTAEGTTGRLPWLLATGTLAVAGVGVGTGFGLRTFAEKKAAERECPTRSCSSRAALAANERAYDAALVSTIAFGAGAVAATVFTYLLVSAKSAPKGARVRLVPAPSHAGAEVVAAGTF